MRLYKRLDWFVLKGFLPLLTMTFFIVLFIVLMQTLWKYLDDLVGKGLEISVMGEFFFYAAVSLVPMALPLAILLASLMFFGNLGERSELTAIKASGISLIRVMRPLIIFVACTGVAAFFYQNTIIPKAQVKMYTLLFSMRQKSPEVEIPEGVFYDQIPGYNLLVKSKNKDTGVLYNTMIYDVSRGGDNATILLADSARLAFTKDMRYLYLHLFTGEQFENLREQRQLDQNVPFRRETFFDKEILIPFDANFNRMDESGMRKQFVGKNMAELRQTIDSITLRVDSIGDVNTKELKRTAFSGVVSYTYFDPEKDKSAEKEKRAKSPAWSAGSNTRIDFERDQEANFEDDYEATVDKSKSMFQPLNLDSLITALTPADKIDIYTRAKSLNRSKTLEVEYKAMTVSAEKSSIRRHDIELLKKFTLSVACIIFFFIGAPLGAIIRKGGLGMPLVISVLLFVVYYIIDTTGYKMARDGRIIVWQGMWLSTFILLPLGVFVTYKAMNDSAVFNKDSYLNILRKVFGLSVARHVPLKEVIINDISERKGGFMLARIYAHASYLLAHYPYPYSYRRYWSGEFDEKKLSELGEEIDATVNYLSDSRNLYVLAELEKLPVIMRIWIYNPVPRDIKWLRMTLAIIFPIGGILYLISLSYRKILHQHLKTACSASLKALTKLNES